MYPYWLLFGFFALGAVLGQGRTGLDDRRFGPGMAFGFLLIIAMVGLRDRVGVDWSTYSRIYRLAQYREFSEVLLLPDPGFQILNWLTFQIGGGIWLVNFLCAIGFTWGLSRLIRDQPFPWLGLLVAIPYLVVVVAMNYTRQAVAIGFVMAGIAYLNRGGSISRFTLFTLAAISFHSSAIVALPLAIIGIKRDRLSQLLVLPALAFAIYSGLLSEQLDSFVENYIDAKTESQGAATRVAMCVVPAIAFLLFKSRLRFTSEEQTLWRNFSLAALALAILLFVLPSSTAVDRIALYILPLQIAVLSRIPFIIGSELASKLGLIVLSTAVLFVWLNFSTYANAWIPYRFILPI